MAPDTQAFLLSSQQRVIDEYSSVLARWPDLPEGERMAIGERLRRAKEQLAAFQSLTRAATASPDEGRWVDA